MDELFENCVKKQLKMGWSTVYLRRYFWMIFLLFSLQTLGQSQRKIIVIDPGHGGSDSGAVGINGIKEKDVVLEFALNIIRLKKLLPNSTFEIYLTRYKDTLISLGDRTRLAKALQADMFISLHCNQSENSNARGTEVYNPSIEGKFTRQSVLLGYEIEKVLTTKLGLKSRGVKFANFQLLRELKDDCKVVLVELGFLTNTDEYYYYQNPEAYRALALMLLENLMKNIDGYERFGD